MPEHPHNDLTLADAFHGANSVERASCALLEPVFERAERNEAETSAADNAELGKNLSEEEGARDAEGPRRLLGTKGELGDVPRLVGCHLSSPLTLAVERGHVAP